MSRDAALGGLGVSPPADPLIQDRVTVDPRGNVGGECPRRGTLWLTSNGGQRFVLETNCKVWRCVSCRDRVQALVQMRIEYGCLMLGRCYFITLTLRKVSGEPTRDAAFVARTWRRFMYLMLKSHPERREMAWFKVVELTKKKQPHLHLVIGGIGQLKKEMVRNEFAWHWAEAVRDRYVDVRAATWVENVLGAGGAAAYMAKYLTKNAQNREELEAKGFLRRWSRNRNWPGGQVRLAGTVRREWRRVAFEFGQGNSQLLQKVVEKGQEGSPLLDRVGNDMAVELARRIVRRRVIRQVESHQRRFGIGDKSVREKV